MIYAVVGLGSDRLYLDENHGLGASSVATIGSEA
jgi:hypothetical protein